MHDNAILNLTKLFEIIFEMWLLPSTSDEGLREAATGMISVWAWCVALRLAAHLDMPIASVRGLGLRRWRSVRAFVWALSCVAVYFIKTSFS